MMDPWTIVGWGVVALGAVWFAVAIVVATIVARRDLARKRNIERMIARQQEARSRAGRFKL